MQQGSENNAPPPPEDAPDLGRDAGEDGGDQLGPYPSKVNVPVLEGRRYLWTARAFAIGFYLSIILNFILGAVIFNLVPLKRVEPMLVTFSDKAEQIVRIEPFEKNTRGFELMTEKLAAEYVKNREEIVRNPEEMRERWGQLVRHRSTNSVYAQFVRQKQPQLELAQSRGLSRLVNIQSVNKFGRTSLRVEFEATDYDRNNNVMKTEQWEVIMRVAYLPQRVEYRERFVNPLGFTVTDYSLRQKLN